MSAMPRSALLLLALCLAGCDFQSGAVESLRDAGYSNVAIGSYAWFGCSKDDAYSRKFTAVGPTGREVRGTICAGLTKDYTIRPTRGAR